MRTFVLLSLVLGIAAYATAAKEKSGGCGDDCITDDDCDAGLCGYCTFGACLATKTPANAVPAKKKSGGCGDDCVFDDDCDAGLCGACDLGICGPSKLKSAIKELAAIKAAVAISSLNSTNAKSKSGGCGDDCDFDSDCDAGLCGSCTLFTCI